VTAERYTAVFTGLLSLKKPGEYLYLSMDETPLGPGTYTLHRDRPPYEKMGREIFSETSLSIAGSWCSTPMGSCGTCSVTKVGFEGT
jgi:hypothetical protein